MMGFICTICISALEKNPFDQETVEPHLVTTTCGHIFHSFCLNRHLEYEKRCPKCRDTISSENFFRIFPDVDVPEKSTLSEKISQESNFGIQMTGKEEIGHGARDIFIKYSDSSCYNCESKYHHSRDCPNQPFIRLKDNGSTTTYSYVVKMEKGSAGAIISNYEDRLRMSFSRDQVQVVFAFVHYDKCCWKCGSPFHASSRCLKYPNAGIQQVWKLMHLENHPLTPEEVVSRYEKILQVGGI